MQGKNKNKKERENYIYIYIYKFVSAKDQSILHLRFLLGNCNSLATTEKYGKFLLLFNFLYLKYQFTKKPKFYFKNVLSKKRKKTPYNAYNRKQYL